MGFLPRLAVGSVQPGADYRPVFWGLLDALDAQGLKIQSFLARSCLVEVDAASTITGVAPRHLDSWLMSRDFCQRTFHRIAQQSDLGVVEGDLSAASAAVPGGQLTTLCDWLALPKLGVLDVRGLTECRLPKCRPPADALLLDGVNDSADFYHRQTVVESLWGIPVLGAIEALPALREAVGRLDPGQKAPADLCRALGQSLLRFTNMSQILDLAERGEFPTEPNVAPNLEAAESNGSTRRPPLTVAVAYDEVFSGYFPDTLDALEQRGVTVCDFSTLRDESLPAGCDLVYIGCGRMLRHAAELSGNHCLLAALRDHVCAGRRIYAEGSGLAYLCEHLVLPDGRQIPMAGVLPAVAHLTPQPCSPHPIELTLGGGSWLGAQGQRLRGYVSDHWRLEPSGPLASCVADPTRRYDLVARHQAIGSRVYFNLAAQPALLESFLQHCPAALDWAAAR